jgi:hypothetical protein
MALCIHSTEDERDPRCWIFFGREAGRCADRFGIALLGDDDTVMRFAA